jgi:hypothetical protein
MHSEGHRTARQRSAVLERGRLRRSPVVAAVLVGSAALAVGLVIVSAVDRRDREASLASVRYSVDAQAAVAVRLAKAGFSWLELLAQTESIINDDAAGVAARFARVDLVEVGFTGGLRWVDLDGELLVSSSDGVALGDPVSLADRTWFTRARAGERAVGQAVISRLLDVPTVELAVPTHSADGAINGVLSAAVRLDEAGAFTAALSGTDSRDQWFVVDSSGHVIVAPFTLSTLLEVNPRWVSAPGQLVGAADPVGRTDRVVSQQTVAGTGWTLVRSLDKSSVFAASDRTRRSGTAFAVASAFIAALLTWFVGARTAWRLRTALAAAAAAAVKHSRAQALGSVIGHLAEVSRQDDLATVVLRDAAAVFDATAGAVWVRAAGGGRYEQLGSFGYADQAASDLAGRHAISVGGIGSAVFYDSGDKSWGELAGFVAHRQARVWAVVPLTDGRESIGIIELWFDGSSALDDTVRLHLTVVGERVAAALGRVRFEQFEHDATVAFERSLRPRNTGAIEGVSVSAHYESSHAQFGFGGDWYDSVRLDDHRLLVVVGDVVGHGLASAAAMGQMRSATHALCRTLPAAQVLDVLDAIAAADMTGLGSSLVCLVIDTAEGCVEYTSAGHPPPITVHPHSDGGVDVDVSLFASTHGPLIGVGPADRKTMRVDLSAPCTFVLFTDGLIERRNRSFDDGIAALADVLRHNPDATPAQIQQWCAAIDPVAASDDAVVVRVDVSAEVGKHPSPTPAPRTPLSSRALPILVLETGSSSSAVARNAVREAMSPIASADMCDRAVLAISEIVQNALDQDSDYSITMRHDGRTVRFDVYDEAPGRPDPRTWSPHRPGGLGLRIVEAVTDRWGVSYYDIDKGVWFEIDHDADPDADPAV